MMDIGDKNHYSLHISHQVTRKSTWCKKSIFRCGKIISHQQKQFIPDTPESTSPNRQLEGYKAMYPLNDMKNTVMYMTHVYDTRIWQIISDILCSTIGIQHQNHGLWHFETVKNNSPPITSDYMKSHKHSFLQPTQVNFTTPESTFIHHILITGLNNISHQCFISVISQSPYMWQYIFNRHWTIMQHYSPALLSRARLSPGSAPHHSRSPRIHSQQPSLNRLASCRPASSQYSIGIGCQLLSFM